jgi:hypothetical protein
VALAVQSRQLIVEIMPRNLLFELGRAYVVSRSFYHSVPVGNPNVAVALVSDHNTWADPTHYPLSLLLVVAAPEHDLITDCKTDLGGDVVGSAGTRKKGSREST